MNVDNDIKIGFKDVLIRPKRSTLETRSEVDITRRFVLKHSGRELESVPIIAANMDTVGTFSMAGALDKHAMLTAVHKHYSVEQWRQFITVMEHNEKADSFLGRIFVSTGAGDQDLQKLRRILSLDKRLCSICIDVANGYSEKFVDFIDKVRDLYPDHNIMAGNVVTGEMTEQLLLSGADIVKIGIGGGSVCVTRVKTGVGYPQLSAIIECADAAHGLGGLIVGDGGCRVAGDIAKAFGAGADFVMLGGMLAGHRESEGEIITENGREYISFYGMSSETAMNKYSGGVANYRALEGKEVNVPLKKDINNTVYDILGGIRSACTYVGARRLKELSKRTTFIRVSEQENLLFS